MWKRIWNTRQFKGRNKSNSYPWITLKQKKNAQVELVVKDHKNTKPLSTFAQWYTIEVTLD